MTERTNQITANIGLYWVCAHLSLRNWNAMPTSRNAVGVDIVVYKNDGPRLIGEGVQVKALSRKISAVPLGNSLDKIGKNGDKYWVIVCGIGNNLESFKPECYVLLADEVRKNATEKKNKQGVVSFWLQSKDYRQDKFRDRWDRIK